MRTLRIDATLKGCKAWKESTLACRIAFKRSMRGRQYGWDALHDAANWFCSGWKAANLETLANNLSQINTDATPQPYGAHFGMLGF